MPEIRTRVTVEEVAADPTDAYLITTRGPLAIESLKIVEGWVAVRYANGGTTGRKPKHWGSYVRVTKTPDYRALVAAGSGRRGQVHHEPSFDRQPAR